MTIVNRKRKEREDLYHKILEAARGLFLEKGYVHTSIRNIAEKIEYSPTTIYLYFKDKDAIFHALHQDGFAIMNSKMMVLQHVGDPFERLKAMGRIYMNFAMENQELYDLMFIQRAPINVLENTNEEDWAEGQTSFGMLRLTVEQCMEAGYFNFDEAEAASFMIWSSMHGMISLYTRHRCRVISEANKDVIVEKGFSQLTKVLELISARK
jgi:AcrR family transcriptional regulator